MPSFTASVRSAAPAEEVWKLLYDPARFPQWWAGIGSVLADDGLPAAGDGGYTAFPAGYPDFPMPQRLQTSRADHRVVISCLVSDLRFEWTLDPQPDGTTRIGVHVDIPDAEAHRLGTQQDLITASLSRLAELAAVS
ncbi:MAG: SRPBCC family protein [Actinomycetota bacterium]